MESIKEIDDIVNRAKFQISDSFVIDGTTIDLSKVDALISANSYSFNSFGGLGGLFGSNLFTPNPVTPFSILSPFGGVNLFNMQGKHSD